MTELSESYQQLKNAQYRLTYERNKVKRKMRFHARHEKNTEILAHVVRWFGFVKDGLGKFERQALEEILKGKTLKNQKNYED